jgi:hypothetical protein
MLLPCMLIIAYIPIAPSRCQQPIRPRREYIGVIGRQPFPAPIDDITTIGPYIDTRRDPAL